MSFLNDSDSKTPTFREWCKTSGNDVDDIESFSLSNSGEWIIIQAEHSIAFISFKSKVGKELWQSLKPFKGQAKGLFLQKSKGKLGFSIEISPNKGLWEWEGNTLSFDFNLSSIESKLGFGSLWEQACSENEPETPKKNTKAATSTNPK